MREGSELTTLLGEYWDWPKLCGSCPASDCDPAYLFGDGNDKDEWYDACTSSCITKEDATRVLDKVSAGVMELGLYGSVGGIPLYGPAG